MRLLFGQAVVNRQAWAPATLSVPGLLLPFPSDRESPLPDPGEISICLRLAAVLSSSTLRCTTRGFSSSKLTTVLTRTPHSRTEPTKFLSVPPDNKGNARAERLPEEQRFVRLSCESELGIQKEQRAYIPCSYYL